MSCMARELCGGDAGSEDKARASTVISSSSSGFGYSDHLSPAPCSPIQHPQLVAATAAMCSSYDSGSEIFHLASGINLIGFPKNTPHHIPGLGNRDDEVGAVAWSHHHHHPHNYLMAPPPLMVGGEADDGEDHSLRCAVFPCERNERPSQGLSLSLSSTNPSGIGLQSFELRQADGPSHQNHGPQFDDQRSDSFYGKSIQPQQMSPGPLPLRNSKYLVPAQELLNELCSLGSNDYDVKRPKGQKGSKGQEDEKRNGTAASSSKQEQSLQSVELGELQRRKAKLLAMLEEVDRRYRHYCNQMKAVVTSFESMAGVGSATVYSAYASKAMSRHFRCLRDGIVGQLQATGKAMGEKDTGTAPGTTKGETPRLRIIDQALRQQRAFQQMTMMENHPWRPQRGLPERSVSVLRAWLFEHFLHPYPSDVDKHILARQTGLSRSQVSNWFINARVRLWKPMVEEMYMEETKEHDNLLDGLVSPSDIDESGRPNNPNPLLLPRMEDQKPSSDQLVRIDSECLSSIISGPDPKADGHHHHHHHLHLSRAGIRNPSITHHHHLMQPQNQWMELDLTSYNQNAAAAAAVAYDNMGTSFGGGGVSLTLGLQQHRGGHHQGVSLAFSPVTAVQGSLFYPREQIEDCHPVVQYSILDGEGQNLPYRNLMGTQLLRDLAG